jgi:hypothetical protein
MHFSFLPCVQYDLILLDLIKPAILHNGYLYLFMQFFPFSSVVIPLGPRYFPWHTVLKQVMKWIG